MPEPARPDLPAWRRALRAGPRAAAARAARAARGLPGLRGLRGLHGLRGLRGLRGLHDLHGLHGLRGLSPGGARLVAAAGGTTTVSFAAWDTVRVQAPDGLERLVALRDGATQVPELRDGLLVLDAQDVGSLVRLATAGLLRGSVRAVEVDLVLPRWHRGGLALPRVQRVARRVQLDVGADSTARLRLEWSSARPLPAVLHELCLGLDRAGHWDQAGGARYGLDRSAALDGRAVWPAGRPVASPVPSRQAEDEPAQLSSPRTMPTVVVPPVMTQVANPHGRVLAGPPPAYRAEPHAAGLRLRAGDGRVVLDLDESRPVEASLLLAPQRSDQRPDGWSKYCVVDLDDLPAHTCGPLSFVAAALRALAACGCILRTGSAPVRDRLGAMGLRVACRAGADEAGEPDELGWYRASVDAGRDAAVCFDPLLRRTPLAPVVAPALAVPALGGVTWDGVAGGGVALPTVSVLVASRRRDDLLRVLPSLVAQSYPALEVLVGTHGYIIEPGLQRELQGGGAPLRFVASDASEPFGALLGRLSRRCDGELLTKVDDDDLYGWHHVTDLVVGWRTSGADLVGKGSRFTHLPERDLTVDRRWSSAEVDEVVVAGGTMLLPRRVLLEVGGWSEARRHVDTHLLERLRDAGAAVHRLHGLDYVYVRRSAGHTWQTDLDGIVAQAAAVYDGLPEGLVQAPPGRPGASASLG